MTDLDGLVASWILMHSAEAGSAQYEDNFWSFEELSRYCKRDPELAWKVITKIYESSADALIIGNLAAGPLEDLLVSHGPSTLNHIEKYCIGHREFVNVLRMVWQNAMANDVWRRLGSLIEKFS